MVAGRRLRGEDEQRAAEHDARGRGDLGVKASLEDRSGAGKAGELRRGVEAGRPVDEQHHPEAERPEQKDRAPKAGPVPPGGEDREPGGQQRDRDQRPGVGIERGLKPDPRCLGEPGEAAVARLTDLDTPVSRELRRDQTGGGGDDHSADSAIRREHRARARRAAARPRCGSARRSLD